MDLCCGFNARMFRQALELFSMHLQLEFSQVFSARVISFITLALCATQLSAIPLKRDGELCGISGPSVAVHVLTIWSWFVLDDILIELS